MRRLPKTPVWRKRLSAGGVALAPLLVLTADLSPAAASPIHPDANLSQETREILANPQYRFCQDKDYRFFRQERQNLCPDLEAFEERCPALKIACARPAWEDELEQPPDLSAFSWLGKLPWALFSEILRVLFWIGFALGALLLVVLLVRRAKLALDREPKGAVSGPIKTESSPDLLRHSPEEWLKKAEHALSEGQLSLSLHYAYCGLVRSLGDAQRVRVHPSHTTGDYLASLLAPKSAKTRADAALDVDLDADADLTAEPSSREATECLRAIDGERFGPHPSHDRTKLLLEKVEKWVSRRSSVVALMLGLNLLGCSDSSVPESPELPHGPKGTALYEQLLNSRAGSFKRRVLSVLDLPADTSTVISLGAQLKSVEWTVVRNFVLEGGHLLVSRPDETFAKVFDLNVETNPCTGPLSAPDLSLRQLPNLSTFVADPAARVLVHCGHGVVAFELEFGQGKVVLVSDSALFENAALAAKDHAALALALSGDLFAHVEYLGPFTGRGARTPLESVFASGFSWWVLHLLVLLGLFALSRGRHFGRPVDPPRTHRRAFVEHALALSQKYQQSRSSAFALQHYAEWTLETLRRRLASSGSDLRSLCRALTQNQREAAALFSVLTTARKADDLGADLKTHLKQFEQLNVALARTLRPSEEKEKDHRRGT